MNWESTISAYRIFLDLEKGLSKNTINSYVNDIKQLDIYITQKRELSLSPHLLQLAHLRDYIYYIANMGVAESTQARFIASLRSFFNFLLLEDKILKNPAQELEVPRVNRKIPEILSISEIDKIIAAIDYSLPFGHRNKAIIETLYSCGLRVSEALSLKISNIFSEHNFIKITGKGDKQRLVPISSIALENIYFYVNNERKNITIKKGYEDFVFLNRRGKCLTRNMIYIIVKDLTARAQITKNVSPHTFRHSFATHLVEGGANLRAVQEMLGHSSITTTEIYTHLDNSFLRDTIINFHPRGRKQG